MIHPNALQSLHINNTRKGYVMSEKQIEWISTREAMSILEVESTQAVRYLMAQYPKELPGVNFGSEKQPRWMLKRSDVIIFQANRTISE